MNLKELNIECTRKRIIERKRKEARFLGSKNKKIITLRMKGRKNYVN